MEPAGKKGVEPVVGVKSEFGEFDSIHSRKGPESQFVFVVERADTDSPNSLKVCTFLKSLGMAG